MIGKFIPKEPLYLYHATYAKNDNSVLKSFVLNGISTTLAKGHGQGEGFYMWTTKQLALNHFSQLESEGRDEGYPLLVSAYVHLDPVLWDIDSESNQSLIVLFLLKYWDFFLKSVPDGLIELEGGFTLYPSKCRKFQDSISINSLNSAGRRRAKGFGISKNAGSIVQAEILGKIFSFLQKVDPVRCFKYECSIFEKYARSPGLGVKYFGKTNLPIESIFAKVKGKWTNAKRLI